METKDDRIDITRLKLGASFPPASETDWRALVDKALKGAPFERLVSYTADDIAIAPLAQGAFEAPRPLLPSAAGWRALARIDHVESAQANEQAKNDIAGGADGLHIVFAGSHGSYGFGVAGRPEEAAAAVLAGIDPADVAISVDMASPDPAAALAIASFIENSGLNPASAQASFGADPFAGLMRGEAGPDDAASAMLTICETAAKLAARGFAGPFAVADARPMHAAGGSEAQELAFVLGAVASMLRSFEAAGAAPQAARRWIEIRMAADQDQFATIAKLRAARLLLARVEQACGLDPTPWRVHAETAWRMMTRTDPYVNALRATIAAFAAATGGADAISVLPYSQALGLPDEPARRLARNTQLILAEESHLAQVADPAAGAGGIEALTGALCQKAWDLFQSSEGAGGISQTIESGALTDGVLRIRDRRMAAIAKGKAPLTGTSSYPDLAETAPDVLAKLDAHWPGRNSFALAPQRLSAPFEALRARAKDRAGAAPTIFLASLGSLAEHNARTNFVRNFLATGGIHVLAGDGYASTADAARSLAESKARVACICSSDALYLEQAEACARSLKEAGARFLLIAQKPGDNADRLRRAGVDGHIFQGADMVALLNEILDHA